MKKQWRNLNHAGVMMSGRGHSGELEGPIEVLFAGMIGAVVGFIFGMLVGSLARIITMDRVKGIIGGRHWAAYGAGAGALALALMELMD